MAKVKCNIIVSVLKIFLYTDYFNRQILGFYYFRIIIIFDISSIEPSQARGQIKNYFVNIKMSDQITCVATFLDLK